MTAIVHIISFLVIVYAAAYLLGKSPGDMLPFVWCGLILVLYVLAFGRALNLIDLIMPLAAAGLVIIVCFRLHRSGQISINVASVMTYVTKYLLQTLSASMVAYLFLCIILPLAFAPKIVTWWDDINFWASDLKSIYYLGGFAEKYANVSPQFGDYPPGVQLAKWYIVHMDRHAFRESLAFTGYQLFNLSFLMPLFDRLKGKKALWGIPLAFVAWCFAGMGEIFGYNGFCADLSMAFLFGAVLTEAVKPFSETDSVDFVRVGTYLAVLALCKSTGYIWSFLAAVIWLVAGILCRKPDPEASDTGEHKGRIRISPRILIAPGIPLIVGGSWVAFCLINRRVAQTTSTMVTYVTSDRYGLSAYTSEFADAFIKAFFTQPVHIDHTWIDLSPALMFLLILALLILLRISGLLCGRSGTFLCVSLPVTGLVYYALIFAAHITMFATETQYLEPEGMIASIERYGAPYILGCLLFISHVWFIRDAGVPSEQERSDADLSRMRIFVICVIALTNIPAAFDGLIGFRAGLEEATALRESFIDHESGRFLETISSCSLIDEKINSGGTRIARVRDGAYYRVQDAYVAYEASPVSVLCPSYKLKDADEAYFVRSVQETHAEYLYVDRQPDEPAYLDGMTEEGGFEFCELYRISFEGGTMKLYQVE